MIYDHYGFPPEVIITLLQHQKCEGKTSTAAIKSRAEEWAKRGIDSLDLVEKKLVTDQLVLMVGYDKENLNDIGRRKAYTGEIKTDFYGRPVPKHARGTANIGRQTSSTRLITDAVTELFDRIVDKNLLIRRLNLTANHIVPEDTVDKTPVPEQLSLFEDYEEKERRRKAEEELLERERKMQDALVGIKHKYGKNAILKGMNFKEGATAKDRNKQIGGHKA